MKKFRFSLLLSTTVIVLTLTAYITNIRPWHMRWGATDPEISMALPGDRYIPADTVTSTRAITIQAPRESVWAWIIQLGQGRGGFYSYEWLENLFAAEMHNAEAITPDLQTLQVGDHISFQANGPYAVVAEIHAGYALMLEGGWSWYLFDNGPESTRLVVRYASFPVNSWLSRAFYYPIFEPAHFVMEQGMMLGIKTRAEEHWRAAIATLSH